MPTPFDVRISAWRAEYHPATPVQDWLLEQAVHESLALDSARSELASLKALEADRARLAWDMDRRVEAERLGARLHRDPVKVVMLLESTAQGCDWLLRRWSVLGRLLDDTGRPWDEAQLSHALDLYGTDPAVRAGYAHLTEPSSIADARSVIQVEIKRLTALREKTLAPLDALERAAAERGEPLHPTKPLARAQRALDAAHRRYHAAHALLLKSLKTLTPPGPRRQAAPAPAPKATPSPRILVIPPAPVPDLFFEAALAEPVARRTQPGVLNISANVRN